MKPNTIEIKRRIAAALVAIQQALSEGDEDSSVRIFVSHHLEELDAAYWKKHAGVPKPSAKKVLELLELHSHWGEDDEGDINKDGLDTFDFTLPGNATQYVISVSFGEEGEVEDIVMES